jgi:hypothetical protein
MTLTMTREVVIDTAPEPVEAPLAPPDRRPNHALTMVVSLAAAAAIAAGAAAVGPRSASAHGCRFTDTSGRVHSVCQTFRR